MTALRIRHDSWSLDGHCARRSEEAAMMRALYRLIARWHDTRTRSHVADATFHAQAAIDHRKAEQRFRMRAEFG